MEIHVLRNFIKKSVLDSSTSTLDKINCQLPHNFLKLEELYLGSTVELLLQDMVLLSGEQKKRVAEFKTNCLNFYVVLASNIKNRFNFGNSTIKFMANFSPSVAVSGSVLSIIPIVKLIPETFNLDLEKTNTEWRLLADCATVSKLKNERIDKFWYEVGEIRDFDGVEMFGNIWLYFAFP